MTKNILLMVKQNVWELSAALIILIFFLLSAFNLSSIGISWDEPIHRDFEKNVFQNGITLEKKYPFDAIYYPQAYYFLSRIFVLIIEKFIMIGESELYHLVGIIVSSIGLLYLYLLARDLFNRRVALFSLIFFIFFPPFFAHAQYNSKDIPAMVIFIIVLYYLFISFKEKKLLNMLFAGFFFGIGLATSAVSLFVIPVFFLSYYIWKVNSLPLKKYITVSLKYDVFRLYIIFALSITSLYLFWPNLWSDPLLVFRSWQYFLNHGWHSEVFYFGKYFKSYELPWHYTPMHLFMSTPVLSVIFFFIGCIACIRKIVLRQKIQQITLILLWFFIPLFYEILPGVVRYDGMRHMFFVVPPMAILGGLAYDHILKLSSRYKFFVIFATLVIFMKEIILIHPYEGSYYNELVRVFIPAHIEKYFEVEYWGVTYREGIEWLNKNALEDSTVCVPIAGHLVLWYQTRRDLNFECSPKSNYLMYFPRRSLISPVINDYTKKKLVFLVSRFNSDLMYIYKIY